MRGIVVFGAVICAAVSLAGCAAHDASAGIQVSMKEMHFTPSKFDVVAGHYTVSAHNTGHLTHTFSLNELGEEIMVPPGKTRTLVLDLAPGTYCYVCRILDHEGLGMHGVLKVHSK